MSYTPTNWNTGDTITASALNKIEQGIANAGGGGGIPVFWQMDSSTIGVDGDFASCLAKLQQGIPIIAAYYMSPLITAGSWKGTYPVLCGCEYNSSSPDEIRIYTDSSGYFTWTANGVS